MELVDPIYSNWLCRRLRVIAQTVSQLPPHPVRQQTIGTIYDCMVVAATVAGRDPSVEQWHEVTARLDKLLARLSIERSPEAVAVRTVLNDVYYLQRGYLE